MGEEKVGEWGRRRRYEKRGRKNGVREMGWEK